MLQLKLQYFGHLMQKANLLESQRVELNLVTEQQEINSAFFLFSGRTDAEAKAPVLRPPDEKSWLIGKDPDTGQKEKQVAEDEMIR